MIYLRITRKEQKARGDLCRLPSAVNVMLNLSIDKTYLHSNYWFSRLRLLQISLVRVLLSRQTVFHFHSYKSVPLSTRFLERVLNNLLANAFNSSHKFPLKTALFRKLSRQGRRSRKILAESKNGVNLISNNWTEISSS